MEKPWPFLFYFLYTELGIISPTSLWLLGQSLLDSRGPFNTRIRSHYLSYVLVMIFLLQISKRNSGNSINLRIVLHLFIAIAKTSAVVRLLREREGGGGGGRWCHRMSTKLCCNRRWQVPLHFRTFSSTFTHFLIFFLTIAFLRQEVSICRC